jgi:hypothetical protein
MAATTGKNISAPSQTMRDKYSSVRSRVFMNSAYSGGSFDRTQFCGERGSSLVIT